MKLNTAKRIFESIQQLADPTELNWLAGKIQEDSKGLSLAFVMAPRKVAKTRVGIIPSWNWQNGTLDQLVRVYLLIHLAEKEDGKSRIETLFDTAEMNELVALYRALPVLPTPEIWLHRATDAVRSNMGPVFDAIAFKNPYPTTYFSELAWNQLVLKCIFNDKPIHLIEGLDERANQALANTLADFAHERWAAGRRVPSQVWRLIRNFQTDTKEQDLKRLAESVDPNDRKAAELVLQNSPLEAWKVLEKEEKAY
ncbi:MAG: hypothetical protein RL360_1685 [Bacteroidota bacterium]